MSYLNVKCPLCGRDVDVLPTREVKRKGEPTVITAYSGLAWQWGKGRAKPLLGTKKTKTVAPDIVQYSFPAHRTKLFGGEQCKGSDTVALTRAETEFGKPIYPA